MGFKPFKPFGPFDRNDEDDEENEPGRDVKGKIGRASCRERVCLYV